jgi:hypothetical protein
MQAMTATLVPLLLALGAAPAGKAMPVVHHDGGAAPATRLLAGPAEVASLCDALTPAERLRTQGDAIERGEKEARHAALREEALGARYEVSVPAARLAFAPYDGPEQRLSLAEPLSLALGPKAKLFPVSERGLSVKVDAAGARRLLDAQRAGRLSLIVSFELPEDVACNADTRLGTHVLPIEPVDWRWVDGDALVARGGASADRPVVTAAQGARPKVDVGEPIAGPADAKKAVVARAADLEGCYADALKADPGVDGVLVVELARAAKPAVAADSTGAPELGVCVQRVLASIEPTGNGKWAVPIRFELVPPRAAGTASAPAGSAAPVVPVSPAAPAAATVPPTGR